MKMYIIILVLTAFLSIGCNEAVVKDAEVAGGVIGGIVEKIPPGLLPPDVESALKSYGLIAALVATGIQQFRVKRRDVALTEVVVGNEAVKGGAAFKQAHLAAQSTTTQKMIKRIRTTT